MTMMQIRYFLTLAEKHNFTIAAAECFVSQPNLSKQIAKMEEELEMVLFVREHKQVELTEAGKLFSGYAKQIYHTYLEATQKLKQFKEAMPIRVGFRAINRSMYETLKKLSEKKCYSNLQLFKGGTRAWEEGKFDMLFTWLTDYVDSHMLIVDERTPSLLVPKGKNISGYSDITAFLDKVDIISRGLPVSGDKMGNLFQYKLY